MVCQTVLGGMKFSITTKHNWQSFDLYTYDNKLFSQVKSWLYPYSK